MNGGSIRRTALALVAAWLPFLAAGAEDAAAPEASPADPGSGYLDYLNAPHAWFSRRVGNLSRQIDSYFGSSDVYDEVSGSYVEIELEQQFAEAGDNETGADFRVKVDLPRTEHRFKLLLESAAAELDPRSDGPANARREGEDDDASGLFAGLRRVFTETAGFQLSTDAGIKVRTPPEAFARARARRAWSLGDWRLRFKETLYWFDADGAGQTAEVDLDRRLDERFALRASTRYRWLDETDEWTLGHGVALYQILDARNSLAYEIGMEAVSRPVLRSERYRVGVRFRRRVHQDWMFLSVVPDVIWQRQEGFRAEPGLSLQLEMLFGERYLAAR
ncbi:hypothetical protein PC39_06589 [Salinisphaera sp. PC39]|uniref:hypothetical protein n=1 Tax=Salinisphaera sp. PC39 TaxID=1304156 RepID=UPI00333F2315